MIHYLNYCPCISLKQWSMPFCAFFTAFSVVMTVLIVSTDLKVGRPYIRFNATYLWDFEEFSQDDIRLSSLIQEKYFQSPISAREKKYFNKKLPVQILTVFRKKKSGIFMECGSDGSGDTEWLERVLEWKGLLTQPQPDKFKNLITAKRNKSHLAQVCISPTIYPKHAYFKYNDTYNDSLEAIPCFPLYSLMQAYNTSHLDLLSFVDVTAPLQVLKTLPARRIKIEVIMLTNSEYDEEKEYEDLCCDSELTSLLKRWGYKSLNSCEFFQPKCYFVCSKTYCPMLTRA